MTGVTTPSESGGVHHAGVVAGLGLWLGPTLAVLVYVLLGSATLEEPARRLAAVTVLMAVWWITEAIPLSATAMLPLVLFHPLNIQPIGDATGGYAHPLVFLFMGGLFLGQALERWGAHRRLALSVILLVGTSPRRIVAGIMLAAALLSAFVSNTATAMMMLPIVTSIALLAGGDEPNRSEAKSYATCLLLALAYSSSIGGTMTITGTAPNAILSAYMRDELGTAIGWGQWLKFGVPLVAILLPITWLVLVFVASPVKIAEIPGGRAHIRGLLERMGRPNRGELLAMGVFLLTALLWITHKPVTDRLNAWLTNGGKEGVGVTGLNDTAIAIGATVLLFLLPAGRGKRVLDWKTAERIPWGVLILFGGGLSLAGAFGVTGLDQWLGGLMAGAKGLHPLIILLGVTTLIVFMTELTSNTATTSTMLPVLGAAAVGLGIQAQPLVIAAAVAASCAFMLPVATPPNAIVFSSGRVTIRSMMKAGVWLNIASITTIAGLVWFLGGRLLAY
ncbi:MAG: DASS family sodium-coupled anion symporter [Phycisphaerales bacterium]